MKKLVICLYAFIMLFAATESYAVLIDDFGDDVSYTADCDDAYTIERFDSMDSIDNMIGDGSFLVISGDDALCEAGATATIQTSGGNLSYVSSEGMYASFSITWASCLSSNNTCDYSSLGGVDLTEAGAHDAIHIRVVSSVPGDAALFTVYTDADHSSQVQVNFGESTSYPSDVIIPFTSFQQTLGSSGPADFTNVGALGMAFVAGGGFNTVIDKIETAALQPPPPTPEEQVEDIQEFFDDSVTSGTLTGIGATPTAAAGKLTAIENMLEQAEYFIDNGFILEACNQLGAIYAKTDGATPPPDFVSGTDAAELAAKILALMDDLGCE